MDQLRLSSGADLNLIKDLDQKLWSALSCPTGGLEFDEATLRMVDTNNDGRIRCQEIIEAVNWTLATLRDPSSLVRGEDGVALDLIDTDTSQGRQLFDSAKRVLSNLGKPDEKLITLGDTRDRQRIFAAVNYNGDGIIPPDAVTDVETKRVTEDILRTVGGSADRGGQQGVTAGGIEAFFKELEEYRSWWEEGRVADSGIHPFGDETDRARGAPEDPGRRSIRPGRVFRH